MKEAPKHVKKPEYALFNRYPQDRLAEILEGGDGFAMRSFIHSYHQWVSLGEEVPDYWHMFVADLLLKASKITQDNPKAREGLLAKGMGLQGRKSNHRRDKDIAITVQQYLYQNISPKKAYDETSERLISGGIPMGADAVRKIWNSRDVAEIKRVAKECPVTDYLTFVLKKQIRSGTLEAHFKEIHSE